jgi:hypothetical protein
MRAYSIIFCIHLLKHIGGVGKEMVMEQKLDRKKQKPGKTNKNNLHKRQNYPDTRTHQKNNKNKNSLTTELNFIHTHIHPPIDMDFTHTHPKHKNIYALKPKFCQYSPRRETERNRVKQYLHSFFHAFLFPLLLERKALVGNILLCGLEDEVVRILRGSRPHDVFIFFRGEIVVDDLIGHFVDFFALVILQMLDFVQT